MANKFDIRVVPTGQKPASMPPEIEVAKKRISLIQRRQYTKCPKSTFLTTPKQIELPYPHHFQMGVSLKC